VKDGFELSEELEWVFNVADDFEVLVDVGLEGSFDWADINVEFNEIPVEGVVVEVKKLVVLFLEHVDIVLEADQDWVDVLEVVLFKGLELLDGAE
jgi:hypothetical protein